MDIIMRWTFRRLSSKTIRWKAPTCSPMVVFFVQLNRGSYSMIYLTRLNSTAHYFIVSLERDYSESFCTISSWVSFALIHSFWITIITAQATAWSIFVHVNLSNSFHFNMDLTCPEIKTEIWMGKKKLNAAKLKIIWNGSSCYIFIKSFLLKQTILLGDKSSVVWDRQTEGEKRRLLCWHITSFLDHTTLCYLQDTIYLIFFSARI